MPAQSENRRRPGSALRKLGWFVAIWLASVLALGLVALAIRFVLL